MCIPPIPSDLTPVTCTNEDVSGPDISNFDIFLDSFFLFLLIFGDDVWTSTGVDTF